MPSKKILLLTPDFPPQEGGVARYLSALADYFHEDIEVLFQLDSNWQSFDPQASYPIYRQNLLFRFFWPRWWKCVSYLRSYKDRYRLILTSHVLPFGSACWIAKKFTGIPYIVFVHGMDIRLALTSRRKKMLAKKVLSDARLVVANSQALAQEVAATFGIQELLVVYPCLANSLDHFFPYLSAEAQLSWAKEDEQKWSTQKNSDGSFHVLTVSRLVHRKGHAHVINALAMLKQKGFLKNVVYDIAGDGPEESTLKTLVAELGLEKEVVFHGHVNDEMRSKLYAQADIFVMPVENDPFDKEGFGLVFIEAAQFGIPCVSTNIPGVNEAIIDGATGILLPDQDPQRLAQVLVRLMQDRKELSRLSAGAQEHAKKFSCEEQLEKLRPYL